VVDPVFKPSKTISSEENGFELIYREENVWNGTAPIN
jgi:hypothetical protein